ncbi:Retinol dehydrogenase 12 [Madurella mycetomatis]|uniref:Retinol dehydrogenase 12 n=1 Tax=Madurella mycetomatis TaxID=100816 RepID=A0A175VSB8_9PEZI|nr:Retinol dehydrogenase 12 [Madurella mycetomatis]
MAPSISSAWTQSFPPKPQFTEKDLPDLKGKVYIVSGANTGIGKELSRILYSKNAKVYIGARNEEKAKRAIDDIKHAEPKSTGTLVFLHLNLADLTSIKASAERFLVAETRLDVLFNNAGYMGPEGKMEKTSHGHEIHLGINCLGTFLFTKLLTPVLLTTAADKATPPNTVRVVFLSSFATELFAEKNVGIEMDNLDYHKDKPSKYRYGISKAGNWAYAVQLSKRYKAQGLIGVPVNPGNIRTELFREQSFLFTLLTGPAKYPIINGAYSELFAGLSPEVTTERAGDYVVPFGRFYPIRSDLEAATKSEAEDGNGATQKFWDWSEEQVQGYL